MTLRDYLDQLPVGGGAALALKLKTSHVYLCQLAAGNRRPSPEMAAAIEKATERAVRMADLRPDLAELFAPEPERAAS